MSEFFAKFCLHPWNNWVKNWKFKFDC